jgi:hypothetical protein
MFLNEITSISQQNSYFRRVGFHLTIDGDEDGIVFTSAIAYAELTIRSALKERK